MSSSIPVSSARISLAEREVAAEHAAQHRVEEEHRVGAERPVRPARLEEVDRRAGQAAQLDLAGDLLDELVALLLGGSYGMLTSAPAGWAARASAEQGGARRPGRRPRRGARRRRARSSGEPASSSRTVSTVIRAASSSGKPPTPVPRAGKAMLADADARGPRAIALRTAASMDRSARPAVAIERDGVDDRPWPRASRPASRSRRRAGTGAWRTAANSIASPPARLSAPPTPVDIHSDRLAAFTMASTSRSQMSPFQSSMRAKTTLSAR